MKVNEISDHLKNRRPRVRQGDNSSGGISRGDDSSGGNTWGDNSSGGGQEPPRLLIFRIGLFLSTLAVGQVDVYRKVL
ncbi:hypothetical protein Hamer_G009170 [Homarus americanus]|uniref:Uncharacterized protein n=1 Tax=Homarus americanus TaxID=6706 RepID=A0A8J5NBV2_HOMAM|nr:hypothetical protein Hamer_G009170 [Homarus americanus]